MARDFDDGIGERFMDPNTIHRSLLHLVSNAIDAFPVDYEAVAERQIRVKTALQNAHLIILEVSDNGCGIKEKDVKRVFDPFFTSKRPGKGIGLGLSITHTIIKNHGGLLYLNSTEGKGTTFHVLLPT